MYINKTVLNIFKQNFQFYILYFCEDVCMSTCIYTHTIYIILTKLVKKLILK